MAGVRLEYEINDETVRRALQELARRGGNAQPAMAAIGEDLLRSHRARFDAQESPEGEPWAPLSDDYKARKPRRQNEILVLNGFLRDTLRYQDGPDSLAFGTDRIQGATMHWGDEERGIPARPWLGLSEDDEAEAARTLLDYLNEPLS